MNHEIVHSQSKKYFCIVLILIGFFSIFGCSQKKSEDNTVPLLLLLNLQNKNDGCNLKTKFAVCVPPGIAGK